MPRSAGRVATKRRPGPSLTAGILTGSGALHTAKQVRLLSQGSSPKGSRGRLGQPGKARECAARLLPLLPAQQVRSSSADALAGRLLVNSCSEVAQADQSLRLDATACRQACNCPSARAVSTSAACAAALHCADAHSLWLNLRIRQVRRIGLCKFGVLRRRAPCAAMQAVTLQTLEQWKRLGRRTGAGPVSAVIA